MENKIDIISMLENEHENISNFVNEVEDECIIFMEKNIIDIEKFKGFVNYIRTYADGTHHKKEEDILFREMLDRLGKIAENLVKNGMLVEHDLARLYVMELENAIIRYEKCPNPKDKICILGNAMSYVYLLRRHIDKENEVVYPYARKNFSEEVMNKLSEEAVKFNNNI